MLLTHQSINFPSTRDKLIICVRHAEKNIMNTSENDINVSLTKKGKQHEIYYTSKRW